MAVTRGNWAALASRTMLSRAQPLCALIALNYNRQGPVAVDSLKGLMKSRLSGFAQKIGFLNNLAQKNRMNCLRSRALRPLAQCPNRLPLETYFRWEVRHKAQHPHFPSYNP